MTDQPKHSGGWPVERQMPEPIPDTSENIMRALLATPPEREDEWEYLRRAEGRE